MEPDRGKKKARGVSGQLGTKSGVSFDRKAILGAQGSRGDSVVSARLTD